MNTDAKEIVYIMVTILNITVEKIFHHTDQSTKSVYKNQVRQCS